MENELELLGMEKCRLLENKVYKRLAEAKVMIFNLGNRTEHKSGIFPVTEDGFCVGFKVFDNWVEVSMISYNTGNKGKDRNNQFYGHITSTITNIIDLFEKSSSVKLTPKTGANTLRGLKSAKI